MSDDVRMVRVGDQCIRPGDWVLYGSRTRKVLRLEIGEYGPRAVLVGDNGVELTTTLGLDPAFGGKVAAGSRAGS